MTAAAERKAFTLLEVLLTLSMSIVLMAVVTTTIPPSVGLAPAARPVPAPLGTTGTSWLSAIWTTVATSSAFRGNTTTLATPRMSDEASLP